MTAPSLRDRRETLLRDLYGQRATAVSRQVEERLAAIDPRCRSAGWDELSAWLIAYPDQVRAPGKTPLAALGTMVAEHLQPAITGVHVLPWHPSSSDGGFSVTSFDRIDPDYGSWSDVSELSASTSVMADAVLNHASARGDWFRSFLADDPAYRGFFRSVEPGADLSAVVRPRSTPLVAEFDKPDGSTASVWATFSHDQIDLDYRNPGVLLRMLDVLLSYVTAGVRAIRLDAVAFLWKEEGTSSIHLRQTHLIVQFLRACIDEIDPGVALVTETNVPHEENISYFGGASAREAQAVYQFPLPPLVLHSFVSGSAAALRDWAAGLSLERDDTTFLNFLASHDGIGLRPVERLLDPAQRSALKRVCEAAGGLANQRRLPDGSEVPYELTGTWYAHMAAGHDEAAALNRHVAAHAVALALRGVPLLYVHSLFASPNDFETHSRSGQGRDLNRARFWLPDLEQDLATPGTRASRVWRRLERMLRARASMPAFHPLSSQEIIDGPDSVLMVRRQAEGGNEALVAVNVSAEPVEVDLPPGSWSAVDDPGISESRLRLAPWSNAWLRGVGL